MSNESDKLNKLKQQSLELINKILTKKSTGETGGGGAGGGGAGGGGGGAGGGGAGGGGGGAGGGGAGGAGAGGAGGGAGDGKSKNGLDNTGVSGPIISGKGNFDDLCLFLTNKGTPIDPTIKTKLEKVYKFINNISDPTDTPSTAAKENV